MTSSMQLAQECLKHDAEEEQAEAASNTVPFEGPELLAQTIESGKKLYSKLEFDYQRGYLCVFQVEPTTKVFVT